MKTNLLFPNKHSTEMELQRSVLVTCVIQSKFSKVSDVTDRYDSVTKAVNEVASDSACTVNHIFIVCLHLL